MTLTRPLRGIDVASHQGELDFNKLVRDKVAFVVAKASEGTYYQNPFHDSQTVDARQHGIIPGSYHYVTNGDPAEQVRNFLRVAGDDFDGRLLMVDVEALAYDGVDYSPRFEHVVGVIEALHERVGPHPILIYSGSWYWSGRLGNPDLSGLLKRYDVRVWDSHYVAGVSNYATLYPKVPRSWLTEPTWGGEIPTILQFSGSCTWAGEFADANAFAGTREGLMELTRNTARGAPTVTVPPEIRANLTPSKVDKAILYGRALLDPQTVYGYWDGRFPFSPGPAMWAYVKTGAPPKPKTQVPNASCTGLQNLMNAAAGIDYRGGTLAYGRDLKNRRVYRPGMAVKRGEVLVSVFADGDEGHIVMALEAGVNPRVISSDHRFGGVQPGVNIHRLQDSHRWFDYEYIGEVPGLGTD